MFRRILLMIWCFSCVVGLTDLAQAGGGATKLTGEIVESQRLGDDLVAEDSDTQQKALEEIRKRVQSDAVAGGRDLAWRWNKRLLQSKRYHEVTSLSQAGILANARDTLLIETLLEQRVRALQESGPPNEALSAAKSMFNVATMSKTKGAIQLLGKSLEQAYQDQDIVARFKMEQIRGATTQPSASEVHRGVLQEIAVDRAAYESAIASIRGNKYDDMVARGNFLLLADLPHEARQWFEKAYRLAPEWQLKAATENLIRCTKAEDGTIGRANAMVLELRPK